MALLAGCPPVQQLQDDHGASLEKSMVILQMQATSPDPAVRANCIEALLPSRDPRAMNVIEQGMYDREWVVRFASVMAAGKRKDTGYKPKLVAMAANDINDSVKAAAIYALRQLGDTANMNALAKFLESPDWSVRANTAMVLGLMGDPSAIPLLLSMHRETDTRTKFEITAALARLGDKNAQKIISALAISQFAEDQWNAMIVCADLPADVAVNPLFLGLVDPPPQTPADLRGLTVRLQLIASRSLGKLGAPQFETPPGSKTHVRRPAEIAVENLTNDDPGIRALAAFALGEMLVPQQAAALTPLLNDPDTTVQRAAAAATVNIYSRTSRTPQRH